MRENAANASDGDIIRRVVHGETDAFECLLDRYRDRVFGIVGKRIPREDAEEVAQNTFVRAYLALPGYGEKGDFGAWLTTIAVRACYDYWRDRYRRREQPLSTLSEDQLRWIERATSDQSDRVQDERASAREARSLLEWGMARLSPEDRAVLTLVHIEERPVKEAAALLGWSAVNVKVRAHRSRKRLRAILEGLLAEREANHEIEKKQTQ